jgi:HD-like signal output (HDOD) protein
VMLGIPPFFRAFETVTSSEDWLQDRPSAVLGFERVLRRSRRAARFATSFAVHRMDHDVAVISLAALLHDFAELLLWLRAPELAQTIAQRQLADPTLRSADVQRELLNIELPDLQHDLMQRWSLPALLVRITDQEHNDTQQVRNVHLAIRLARHSSQGWDNAALPDDVRDTAALLNIGAEPTWRLLREIDGEIDGD